MLFRSVRRAWMCSSILIDATNGTAVQSCCVFMQQECKMINNRNRSKITTLAQARLLAPSSIPDRGSRDLDGSSPCLFVCKAILYSVFLGERSCIQYSDPAIGPLTFFSISPLFGPLAPARMHQRQHVVTYTYVSFLFWFFSDGTYEGIFLSMGPLDFGGPVRSLTSLPLIDGPG